MQEIATQLIDYLKGLQEKGQTTIRVDQQARSILREWHMESRLSKSRPTSSASVQMKSVNPSQLAEIQIKVPKRLTETLTQVEEVSTEFKVEPTMESIQHSLKIVAKHYGLDDIRETCVFSPGNLEGVIMFVGEAPSYLEEIEGKPMVGEVGDSFSKVLKAMGTSREAVYLTNVIKYRPSLPNQTMHNRKPRAEEIQAFIPILEAEIAMLKPKIIVLQGITAAQALLQSDETLEELRGFFHQFQGIPVRVSYHPSVLLNALDNQDKRQVWEDMLAVMEQIQMPISERQRGYFLK